MKVSKQSSEFVAARTLGGYLVGLSLFTFVVILVAAGCTNIIKRSQSPDDQAAAYQEAIEGTRFVGQVARPWGMEYVQVEGIALVTQLNGTGSNPRKSGQRDHLAAEIKSHEISNVNEILSSKNTSMALVRGFLKPGIQKGDKFDLEVRLMDNSETTSLRSGYLMKSRMTPMAAVGRRVKKGKVLAVGQGRLLVDSLFESQEDINGDTQAIILGGGTATESRPVGLVLATEAQSIQNATAIARAINARFTIEDSGTRRGIATPKTDQMIEIDIPPEYQKNKLRFFNVILNLAYGQTATERLDQIQSLERQLNTAAFADRAALQLEAIGEDAIPTLRRALRNADTEVRFHAALALAYLGDKSAVPELKSAARIEPAFRFHALNTLSTFDHPDADAALSELMNRPSPETRYGAYRALRNKRPNDPLVKGIALGKELDLVMIPTQDEPMIHFSKTERPEIVVFGDDQRFQSDFLFLKPGFTIKAVSKGKIEVTRYHTGGGESREQCSDKVTDVIATLARLGMDYGDVLEVFKDAKQQESLGGRLVINAVPRPNRQLTGGLRSELEESELLEYSEQFIADDFETGSGQVQRASYEQESSSGRANPAKPPRKRRRLLDRMKDWFKR